MRRLRGGSVRRLEAARKEPGRLQRAPAPLPSPDKALTAFGFAGLTPPVDGVINEAAHAIALTVPSDPHVGALVASFTTTGGPAPTPRRRAGP